MSTLERFGLKLFFADDASPPRLSAFIPLFHRFIRESALDGLLVDVADYGHVHQGPGIVLVGHEANYGIDETGGRRGLLYLRKRALSGTLEERLLAASRSLVRAARAIERAPELGGAVRFRADSLEVFANDRRLAPNDDAGWAALEPSLRALASGLFADAAVRLERPADPRERLGAEIRTAADAGLAALAGRLGENP